jgi:hypothetical protein
MALKGFRLQFFKLRTATKMILHVDSSESIEIDKLYNDPIRIIPPHLGRLLVLKSFIELGENIFPLLSPWSTTLLCLEVVISFQLAKGHAALVL